MHTTRFETWCVALCALLSKIFRTSPTHFHQNRCDTRRIRYKSQKLQTYHDRQRKTTHQALTNFAERLRLEGCNYVQTLQRLKNTAKHFLQLFIYVSLCST